ncbi:vacuolar protein sorting-associated protein [Ceratobasidium sp. AG-Ba]|nr:vacuolar protein sorting-associated protein [Ceratobasidium sp. AG-Ba]QRW05393.1 vacuolar protein sorting-associated protein [Ceratobasidium sp. AG-Ba]
MAEEKTSKELPIPVGTARPIRHPNRLRNALALTAACGLFYLGTSSWQIHRHHDAEHVDPLLEASKGIHHRHKGFGWDPKKAEDIFLSVPTPESAIAVSRAWTAKPHITGSDRDYDSALEQLEVFQKHFGIKPPKKTPVFDAGSHESRQSVLSIHNLTEPTAWIDTYYSFLNSPAERKLEILNDDGTAFWSANVEETPAEGDPAGEWHDAIGAWHGFSKGGDVQGKLVYANYGSKKDFDDLAAAGHNLTGTVVLVRYGGVFRGLKVKAAQEAGAVGCLIYSDPRDNGPVTVENGYKYWPDGPALNPDSVQRGSVTFLSKYPGDPTTPGYPSYRDAERVEPTNLPSIPSLPVSWANAQVLLKELGDSVFSPRKIRLLNGVKEGINPMWNTMAVVPGHIKNEVIVVGNHRDAWVLGAADPTSGTVTVHEVVKGLGELLKKGWKPLRTIVFASWDGEEYGLLGSTEWGEDFADWIQQNVVAYLNVDVSAAGETLGLAGSPSLAHLIRQVASNISHPTDANRTLWDATGDFGPYTGPADKETLQLFQATQNERKTAYETGVVPLGSGSDFTVFLQRLGIASSDQSFSPNPMGAVYHYHSVWDSQTWMEKYGDPGFLRHVAISKHMGLMLLRLVDSIIVPLNTTQYALELDNYLDRVTELSTQMTDAPDFTGLRHAIKKVQKASIALDHRKIHAEHRLKRALEKIGHQQRHLCGKRRFAKARTWVKKVFGVHDGVDKAVEKTSVSWPQNWPEVARVTPRVGRLPAWTEEQEKAETHKHEHERHRHHRQGKHHGHGKHGGLRKLIRAVKEVQAVNKKLSTFEQSFLSEEGIPDREWYRHLGVAPGKWLGYGATTLPALTEAITIEKNATLAAHEAERLTTLFEKMAEKLK